MASRSVQSAQDVGISLVASALYGSDVIKKALADSLSRLFIPKEEVGPSHHGVSQYSAQQPEPPSQASTRESIAAIRAAMLQSRLDAMQSPEPTLTVKQVAPFGEIRGCEPVGAEPDEAWRAKDGGELRLVYPPHRGDAQNTATILKHQQKEQRRARLEASAKLKASANEPKPVSERVHAIMDKVRAGALK